MTLKSASVLILNDQGQVLVVHRKRGPGVCMPGGKLEAGEDIKAAAVRETREETGLVIDPCALWTIYHAPCTSEEGVVYQAATVLADRWSGDLGGEEPELAPYWGEWADLIERSPFGDYNAAMVRDGFIEHLRTRQFLSPRLSAGLDRLIQTVEIKA